MVLQITVPHTEEGLEEAPKALEEPVEDVLHVQLLSAQKELEDLEVHLDLQGALVVRQAMPASPPAGHGGLWWCALLRGISPRR